MIDDKSIIELLFDRSEKGLAELDVKYGKLCHKLSRNILNNRQDAEECVNDAYLGVWNAIPPAKPNPMRSSITKTKRKNGTVYMILQYRSLRITCPRRIPLRGR